MKYLIAIAFIGGNAALIWAGIHYGSRWIDKLLCVPPPFDPSKPIVRRIGERRQNAETEPQRINQA